MCVDMYSVLFCSVLFCFVLVLFFLFCSVIYVWEEVCTFCVGISAFTSRSLNSLHLLFRKHAVCIVMISQRGESRGGRHLIQSSVTLFL